MKTGALLRYACVAGRSSARRAQANRTLDRYGSALGEAFQIADDLLDLEGDPATVGKATGKDAAAHKATWSACSGRAGQAAARSARRRGASRAQPFGADAEVLKAAARFVATRTA